MSAAVLSRHPGRHADLARLPYGHWPRCTLQWLRLRRRAARTRILKWTITLSSQTTSSPPYGQQRGAVGALLGALRPDVVAMNAEVARAHARWPVRCRRCRSDPHPAALHAYHDMLLRDMGIHPKLFGGPVSPLANAIVPLTPAQLEECVKPEAERARRKLAPPAPLRVAGWAAIAARAWSAIKAVQRLRRQ
jgi:hypothetical protein